MGPSLHRSASGAQPEPVLLSIADGARLLGVSPRFLRILANRNQLRLVRLGRRALVPRTEIDRLVAEGAP